MTAESTPDNSPIFVIGTGRSGTTLLRMMLCAHPRIHLTHEASFYLWEAAFPWKKRSVEDYLHYFIESFSYRWLRQDPRPILAALPKPITCEQIPLLYTAVMRAQAAAYGKVRFGDKTPGHSGSLARIFRDYPDARVVRIVRDPRGVVKSLSRMPWGSHSIIAASMLCEAERKQVANFRDRILEIRLEDLLASPRAVLGQVLDYVGETWSDNVLDHTAYLPQPDDLPPVPWFQSATHKPGKQLAKWSEYGPREIGLIEYLNRGGIKDMAYEPAQIDASRGRWSIFLRWLTDLPECLRFHCYFARLALAMRDPKNVDSPKTRALFAALNPPSWALYPGFELPWTPQSPEGWDTVRADSGAAQG